MSTTKPHHPPAPKNAPAHPAPPAAPQPPAYVQTKWSYPFAVGDGKDASDAHSFFEALSNAEDGFYPLGANGIWHGGIHFDDATGKILKQEDGVRAIADGEVVAYRLDSKYPVLKYQDGKSCMYSTGFVLVRHKLVLPPAPNAASPAGGVTAAFGASNASTAPTTSTAHPASGSTASSSHLPSPAAPASPPADETLTFFSLYMHQLDWTSYKAALNAPSSATDPSKTSNQPAVSPIKCMPFWKGDKRYRVSASATDTQRRPSRFDFYLPDSLRLDAPDSGFPSPSTLSDSPESYGNALGWLDPLKSEPDANFTSPFRIDEQQSGGKPKAKQPLAKGAQVYSKAKGEPVGLLPQGCEVQLGAVTEKDKGWAPITKVLKGEPVGVVVGDPVDRRVATGWVKVDQFDVLIDPQPLDSVVVLDIPYPIAAGAVVGYLGEYQRYREASKLPPSPQRSIMHLEVFAGPDLPAFIKRSQARAKQLPDQKAFLEIPKGVQLVDVAEAKVTVAKGLLLKPLVKDAGDGAWVSVQPTRMATPVPSRQPHGRSHGAHAHHTHVKPLETPESTPVWVERAMAGRTTTADVKAWGDFPLSVSNANGPASGFDEVFSGGELEKLGAEFKARDDKKVRWWKVTVGTADGNSREGWVCETGQSPVQWRSAWEWPGFEIIDNTGVSLTDSFKRHLYVHDLLFDGDKDEFQPSAIRVSGSDLLKSMQKVANRLVARVTGDSQIEDLENAVDQLGNRDGKVSAQELARAQRTRWVAQAMSHLVVRYESEWGGDLSKWESMSSLMKERKYIWQAELERIEKLRWWGQTHGILGLPADPAVYHFHPVGLVANFLTPRNLLADLIREIGDIIASGEGGYEAYNTGTETATGPVIHSFRSPPVGTVTGKTINEIIASSSLPPTNVNRLRATGKYQTITPTLISGKNALGLSGEEKYDANMQERFFREYLFSKAGNGKLAAFVERGEGSLEEAQYAASREWASIAAPYGKQRSHGSISNGEESYYEGSGNKMYLPSTKKLIAILERIENLRKAGALN